MASANVRSIEAVRAFRAAVEVFLEEANAALDSLRIELQRSLEWIEHDRPAYWQAQQRRAFDLVASTRSALETCLMRTVAGRRPSCLEEKEAHAAAKRRLDMCREQFERVKQWSQKLHHEGNEFRGRMSSLRRALDHDVPQLSALLSRTVAILEGYAGTAPPPAEPGEAPPDPSPTPSEAPPSNGA